MDNFSLSFSDEGKESLYRAALIAFFQQALKQGIGKRLYSFPPSRSEPEERRNCIQRGVRAGERTRPNFRCLIGRNRKAAEQRKLVRAGQGLQNFFYPCMPLKTAFKFIDAVSGDSPGRVTPCAAHRVQLGGAPSRSRDRAKNYCRGLKKSALKRNS